MLRQRGWQIVILRQRGRRVMLQTRPVVRTAVLSALCAAVVGAAALAGFTRAAMRDFPAALDQPLREVVKPQVAARDGSPLSESFENPWNTSDVRSHIEIPDFLRRAFVVSEDQHFYRHHGVDWPARLAAAWTDLKSGEAVRGASTISEQVVRMLHPRTRTPWSRWVEGFEARTLEDRFGKDRILDFYLNQVPYGARRRGVAQAARYYFDRDLAVLTRHEMLLLAVLIRSPAGMDLRRHPLRARQAMSQLAARVEASGDLSPAERREMAARQVVLAQPRQRLEAVHFVRHVLQQAGQGGALAAAVAASGGGTPAGASIPSTLDPYVQVKVQQILDGALAALARRKVRDGAVLVVDHARNEILAWVVGRSGARKEDAIGFDTVLTPRQPGSTMKPLLYAIALEKGWTPATLIDDSELATAVGGGQHTFHNYSHVHYGLVRLREALGNSLNIPAVKTLEFVGGDEFLERLRRLGVTSLQQHPDFYGDGLALGNGEVSLYEMTQAYTALARRGRFLPLAATRDELAGRPETQAYSPEVTSLIGNILSDGDARMLEFGRGLQFPVETAIKTGTSTDYRDSWAIAFDYAHTVGVWMGNLDNTPMDGVTGAIGPAMVVRSIFSELNRGQDTRGLWLSPRLVAGSTCRRGGQPPCETVSDWFVAGTEPRATVAQRSSADRPSARYRLIEPTPGLQVARDPRIPVELQALPMMIGTDRMVAEPLHDVRGIEWFVDGQRRAQTHNGKFAWPLAQGPHQVVARVRDSNGQDHLTAPVNFYVR
jgi:penicillin-binding protein 1C